MKTVVATILGLCLFGGFAGSGEPGKKRTADPPVGVWKNAKGAELRVTEQRLFWSGSITFKEKKSVKFDADYAVLKDSIIVGYITNVEVEERIPPYVNTPFSFHFRVDDDVLTIKEVKGNGLDYLPPPGGTIMGGLIQGKYSRTDEKKSEEKKE